MNALDLVVSNPSWLIISYEVAVLDRQKLGSFK
jgi:hypothetical protein